MPELTQEEFLFQVMTEEKTYSQILNEYPVTPQQLTEWWDTGSDLRFKINQAKQVYNNKKGKGDELCFESPRKFVDWYLQQKRICFYCGIEEHKLQSLFGDPELFKTKRFRGKNLELDRKNARSNEYSEENCVLACYLCNNHKSDYISDTDHKEYFAPAIRKFLEDKYAALNGS